MKDTSCRWDFIWTSTQCDFIDWFIITNKICQHNWVFIYEITKKSGFEMHTTLWPTAQLISQVYYISLQSCIMWLIKRAGDCLYTLPRFWCDVLRTFIIHCYCTTLWAIANLTKFSQSFPTLKVLNSDISVLHI